MGLRSQNMHGSNIVKSAYFKSEPVLAKALILLHSGINENSKSRKKKKDRNFLSHRQVQLD